MNNNKYVISCQVWEWYGDDDYIGEPGHGRFKPKGGQEFIFEYDGDIWADEDDLFRKFNERYNHPSNFIRYEAREINYYTEPMPAEIIDGEIMIKWK